MVSPQDRGMPIIRTKEYEDFLQKLTAYHESRGTSFDPEPRIGNLPLDLRQLYNSVIERGGYDQVSEEKLGWRRLGNDFNFPVSSSSTLAFNLKTIYYKYLAAYEIKTVHGKEPPPKEILEELTARGGNLLTRTLENYKPSAKKDMAYDASGASGDDGTPVREAVEEVPGSGGRATRGLRHAPPQRVLFQPDTQPTRQRHTPVMTQSTSMQQQPRGASVYYQPPGMEGVSQQVTNYEPRPVIPLTLRPVITPGNNPTEFIRRKKLQSEEANSGTTIPRPNLGVMLPGSGYTGPNIYHRCLLALKSKIPDEVAWALNHLVKMTKERGDKYKFEAFPGLAEALIEKILEVGALFYEISWEVSYEVDAQSAIDVLDGVNGTKDILQRISSLERLYANDNLKSADFSNAIVQTKEASLSFRNMCMLEDNAEYVSKMHPLLDMLCIVLNLPNLDSAVELKHYALDIAEQITKYIPFSPKDPLYVSLLAQLESEDRGAILTSLRAISRISMNLEESNLLTDAPKSALQQIMNWILLPDEELVHACLDFLYQYTAVVDNVEFLLSTFGVHLEPLVSQLTRLLMHGSKNVIEERLRAPDVRLPAPLELAPMPTELLAELSKLEEPRRSSQWLRCFFEEDADEFLTQIVLWQAYQREIAPSAADTMRPLLPAADFIKNVSTTFGDKTSAQVTQVQQGQTAQRLFIIKGIRMRTVPVDIDGRSFYKCQWGLDKHCGSFYMDLRLMWKHIITDHLQVTPMANGKYDDSIVRKDICLWNGCHKFHDAPASKLTIIASHIKSHLPLHVPEHIKQLEQAEAAKRPSYIIPGPKEYITHYVTAIDEHGDAAGIPLSAVLVLRNLARNISKTRIEEVTLDAGSISWVERFFFPLRYCYGDILSRNRSLAVYMTDLLLAISKV